jgi:hypothetical protein
MSVTEFDPVPQTVEVHRTPVDDHPHGRTVTIRINTSTYGRTFQLTPTEACQMVDALGTYLATVGLGPATMKPTGVKGWIARHIIADDTNPEYSRLDHMDLMRPTA